MQAALGQGKKVPNYKQIPSIGSDRDFSEDPNPVGSACDARTIRPHFALTSMS